MPRIEATDSRSFDPLPEGEYLFVIVKATEERGQKEPHNVYIHLQLQEPTSKKNVWENLVFSPKTAWKVTQFWRGLGHDVKKGDPINIDDPAELQGLEIRAYVSIRDEGDSRVDYFIDRAEGDSRKPPAQPPVPPKTSKAVQPF